MSGHYLRDLDFGSDVLTPFAAVCVCGWRTHPYASAGLAESVLDAHVQYERARKMHANAALMRLQSLDQRLRVRASRNRFAEIGDAIRDRSSQALAELPPGSRTPTVAAVDGDPALLAHLAQALAARTVLHLVGRGGSGVDALSLAAVEQPRVLVVADELPDLSAIEVTTVARYLSPGTRVCIYAEQLRAFELADLVVPKDVSVNGLVRRLSALAA